MTPPSRLTPRHLPLQGRQEIEERSIVNEMPIPAPFRGGARARTVEMRVALRLSRGIIILRGLLRQIFGDGFGFDFLFRLGLGRFGLSLLSLLLG